MCQLGFQNNVCEGTGTRTHRVLLGLLWNPVPSSSGARYSLQALPVEGYHGDGHH